MALFAEPAEAVTGLQLRFGPTRQGRDVGECPGCRRRKIRPLQRRHRRRHTLPGHGRIPHRNGHQSVACFPIATRPCMAGMLERFACNLDLRPIGARITSRSDRTACGRTPSGTAPESAPTLSYACGANGFPSVESRDVIPILPSTDQVRSCREIRWPPARPSALSIARAKRPPR